MKRQDIKKLRDNSVAELNKMEQELLREVAKAKLEKKAMKLKNTALAKSLADDLARVKTVLRERQLAGIIDASHKTEKVQG